MQILALVHVASEGTGTLGAFLDSVGADIKTVRLYDGEPLPDDPQAFHAVVSMGGPMNVYEEAKYPFLKAETEFLRKAVNKDLPVLGICLGSQMIAKACGARVELAAAKEVGWGVVKLTEEGRKDPLFSGLPERFHVLQWHEDMFHVPEGGHLLASSEICPYQAFRYRNAVGLQFHLEVDAEILEEWFSGKPEAGDILRRYRELAKDLAYWSETMYRNLLGQLARKG